MRSVSFLGRKKRADSEQSLPSIGNSSSSSLASAATSAIAIPAPVLPVATVATPKTALNVPVIKANDGEEQGQAGEWCKSLVAGEIASISAQLKSLGCDVDRDIGEKLNGNHMERFKRTRSSNFFFWFFSCSLCLFADGEGHNGLMFAAQEGRDDIVRLLLNNKADIKRADQQGRTALMWAAIHGRESSEFLCQPFDLKL